MVTLRVEVCVLCHRLLSSLPLFFLSFLGGPAPSACFDRAVKNKEFVLFFVVKLLSIVFDFGLCF